MKKLILSLVVVLLIVAVPSALAWQTGGPPDYWLVGASVKDLPADPWLEDAPLEIQIDGNPADGQTFSVGDTITITGDLYAVAQSCSGGVNGAYTEWLLEVNGPSGSDSTGNFIYDQNSTACAVADIDTALTINYTLTIPGTHTVHMSSYAAVSQYYADVAEDATEDLLTFEVAIPPCTTIKDGTLMYSTGHYLEGSPLTTGYDIFGYNYQAHKFSGSYFNNYSGGAGLPPYEGDADAYLAENPTASSHWAWPYRDVDLMMKWNDAWLSNQDCDGDGKLDRYYGFDSYIGSGAWLTNHMSGAYDMQVNGKTKKYHWTYFVKIVAPLGTAEKVDSIWYNAEGLEIGPDIWGSFAIIQQVENDPFVGVHGKQYGSPAGPGFGQYAP